MDGKIQSHVRQRTANVRTFNYYKEENVLIVFQEQVCLLCSTLQQTVYTCILSVSTYQAQNSRNQLVSFTYYAE